MTKCDLKCFHKLKIKQEKLIFNIKILVFKTFKTLN